MTFEEFVKAMSKELYVFRMASGRVPQQLLASRETRLTRVRRRIDDAVLQRALTITDERRCAAVSPSLTTRCEYQRGHGPVQGRARLTPGGTFFHDRDYDHAAPSRGVWWSEPEEAHA
jgi:hypothetical protein